VKVAVVDCSQPGELTGLSLLVEEALAAYLAAGASVTLVQRLPIGPIPSCQSSQPLRGVRGDVEIVLWAADLWSPPFPERFHYALEELVRSRSIDRVLLVGAGELGQAAAIACGMLDVPLPAKRCWSTIRPRLDISAASVH
jgi:hypothetical protein